MAQPAIPLSDSSMLREAMVASQVRGRGVRDPRVLDAMRQIPREAFVPEGMEEFAYEDSPLPIAEGQTISQPFIVALMIEAAAVKLGDKVLDVGTGSGYAAAVLAELAREVYTIEIVAPLAEQARRDLERLGYANVWVKQGDGYRGWPEHAPFDAIVVTAAPDHVPEPLLAQLAQGGRLVLPLGGSAAQELVLITRSAAGFTREQLLPVRFVPMTGEAQGSD